MTSIYSYDDVRHETIQDEATEYSVFRILIVEDDMTSQAIWEYIFKNVGHAYCISWASSVIEAEEMLDSSLNKGFTFDLILSDIFLSGSLTGIDLWHELQEGMPNLIILMSASEPAKIKKYLKTQKPFRYIQKPINIRETIEILKDIMDEKRKDPLEKARYE